MKKLFLTIILSLSVIMLAQAQNTSPYWSLSGNSNATNTSKLGTTNAINLRLFTNNLERMRISSSGNVGIGKTGPNAKLHLNSATGQDALRVQVNEVTKLLVHKNGGVAIGINITPPANGLLVNGNVAIGTATPFTNSKLEVVNSSPSSTGIYVTGESIGLRAITSNSTGVAILGSSLNIALYGDGNYTGVYGYSGNGKGVEGSSYAGHGVRGSSNNGLGGYFESVNFHALQANANGGYYAGIFYGPIYVNGTYYGSDKNIKKNIQEVGDAMSIINKLKPKYYEFRDDGKYALLHLPKGNHYGLLAQEVEEVLPNLVKESAHELKDLKPITALKLTAHGTPALHAEPNAPTESINIKAVNYTELIPILIKAIQEQQQTISTLTNRIAKLEAGKSKIDNTSLGNLDLIGVSLGQNHPNPADQTTTFNYTIPVGANAHILVYDAAGKLVKALIAPTKGQVQMDTSDLKSGIYVYSLLVDGKLAVSKQMILSK